MKLKKFVAAAAAVVMSLAMLTACGGGGGGNAIPAGGWTRELIMVEENGQEVAEADASRTYYTSDGKWLYMKSTSKGHSFESLYKNSADDTEGYALNTGSDPWKAYKYTTSDDDGTTTKTESTGAYKGKTYKTVIYTTIDSDGDKTVSTYYYDGASLKYIKTEQSGSHATSSVQKILVDKSGVDKANEKKLDINNYTLVNSQEELGR